MPKAIQASALRARAAAICAAYSVAPAP